MARTFAKYAHFRKPRVCPRASELASSLKYVSEGDMILYEVGGRRSLARVLGLATHDGDGKKYPKAHLAVITADETLAFGYERHVDLNEVVGVRQPGAFTRWFLFGKVPKDPETAYGLVEFGAMSNSYLDEFLSGDELRPDWYDVAWPKKT